MRAAGLLRLLFFVFQTVVPGPSWGVLRDGGPAVRGRDDKDVDAALGIERALFITLEPPFSGPSDGSFFGALHYLFPGVWEKGCSSRVLAPAVHCAPTGWRARRFMVSRAIWAL